LKPRIRIHSALVLAVILVSTCSLQAAPKFTSFDFPGAHDTYAQALNLNGDATGQYDERKGGTLAYVRFADGTFVPIPTPSGSYATPWDINDSGFVTGYLQKTNKPSRGFILTPDNQLTAFDVAAKKDTVPAGINTDGVIAGAAYLHRPAGFLRALDGSITTFRVPRGLNITVSGINAKGAVVGTYYYSDLVRHFFIRSAQGKFTTFDAPGSAYGYAYSINDKGWVTGQYDDNMGWHGFARSPDGTIVPIDVTGEGEGQGATPVKINSKNVVVGHFYDSNYVIHGFVRAADGTITTFDYPGALSTFAESINDKGLIVGYYDDGKRAHGFFYRP
jgi:uncharacterized membrane protein